MGRMVPIGIRDKSDLESGNYYGNVEVFTEKFSKDTNKLMYGLQLGVLQPAERAGRKHFVNFVIGTEEDPNAEQAETWKEKADQMKRFCTAVGVPMEGENMDTVAAHVLKKNVCFRVEHRMGSGDFAGRMFVNVVKWAPEGTMEPMLDAITPDVGTVEVTAPVPVVAPQAPVPLAAPTPIAPVAVPQVPVAPAAPVAAPTAPPVPLAPVAPENPTPGSGSYPFPPAV